MDIDITYGGQWTMETRLRVKNMGGPSLAAMKANPKTIANLCHRRQLL